MCHPEHLADFTQIEIVALELESRSTRRHFQVRNLCKRVQYFLGNAITEVGRVLVIAQIFKWKHCDAFRGNSCGRLVLLKYCTSVRSIASKEKQADRDNRANNDNVNPRFAA